MSSITPSPLMKRAVPFGILGGLAFLLIGLDAKAQPGAKTAPDTKQQADAKAQDAARRASVVREGFTRPGNPPDVRLPNGKIRYVAWDPANKEDVIGGTVYWMVLRRTGSDTDPWGTGIAKFTAAFHEGKDFQSRYSPALDTDAQYLYLYQVVNDRGLDPLPIKPAAKTEIPTKPIARTSLRLLVDPREITSWGYFKDLGFAAEVVDRKFDGTSAAGLGQPDRMIRMAVSSNPSILGELPQELYTVGSPAYPLGDLRQTFSIGQSTVGLASSWAAKELKANKIKYASWADNELQAVEGALAPDYVLISVAGYDFQKREAPEAGALPPLAWGESEAQFVFQAYWDKEKVKLGQHTVIFGFTSNLPPVDEEIRVADLEAVKQGAAIRPAANEAGVSPAGTAGGIAAAGMAPGTAPTPAGAAAPTGFAGPIGSIGGMAPGVGGGGGGGFGFPGGFGGGFSGGFGGGFGNGFPASGISGGSASNSSPTQQQRQQQQQTTPPQPTPTPTPVNVTVTNTNNNNVTNTNNNNNNANNNNTNTNTNTNTGAPVTVNVTQNQSQSQNQTQSQNQNQTQTGTPPAIPEPAAILLAALALPLLFLCWRRTWKCREKIAAA